MGTLGLNMNNDKKALKSRSYKLLLGFWCRKRVTSIYLEIHPCKVQVKKQESLILLMPLQFLWVNRHGVLEMQLENRAENVQNSACCSFSSFYSGQIFDQFAKVFFAASISKVML